MTKNILVIDDDIHIGNVLEETLVKEGYGVSRAYSGTEALLVLAHEKPDLILLDLMLPGLCGEEVLPKIKGIPVIVMSAKGYRQQGRPSARRRGRLYYKALSQQRAVGQNRRSTSRQAFWQGSRHLAFRGDQFGYRYAYSGH